MKRSKFVRFTAFYFALLAFDCKSCYTPISRNARAFNALLGLEYRASAFLLFLLPLTVSCVMIKCRKQLRGVTALLGLEYRGKAAFFVCFQRQTVLYFEQRPSTLCSPNPRIPCGLCRRSLGSSPAIYSLNLRILRGYHRRVSIKFSGNLLASVLSVPVTVPPENFHKALW